MAKCFRSECPNVRASGAFFIFRLRLSAAFNLLAQMKGIQKRLDVYKRQVQTFPIILLRL